MRDVLIYYVKIASMYEPPAIYGIIGHPLHHSLSPLMHNAAFEALKVNAVYKLFPLEDDEELKLFMEDLKEDNNPIFGINVTVPYKEKVLPFLGSIDPLAEKIGAVNTIVIDHRRKMRGYNTDGPGFLAHLTELGFDPAGKRIVVLGSGGAARAIVSVLCMVPQRPERIMIYNRTMANAEAMLQAMSEKIPTDIVSVADDVEGLNIELADLLVNATSVGLSLGDPALVDPQVLHKDLLVYDIVYNPPETELLKQARMRDCRTSNGLGMLFYQGVLAFQHWAEMELDGPTKKTMRRALEDKRHGA